MLQVAQAVKVLAPVDAVWEMAQDVVRRPLKYMPLAVSAEPVRVSGGLARSAIRIFGFTLRELVRIDETRRIVTWLVDENSDWAGHRELRVASGPKGGRSPSSVLTLAFAWAPLSAKARALDPRGFRDLVEAAAVRLGGLAEARAAKGP